MKRLLNGSLWIVVVATVVLSTPGMAAVNSLLDKVHEDFKSGRSTDAVALLQLEAERDNPEAQYGLGVLYEKGLPEAKILPDESQAFHWYNLSAQKGYAASQNNLGYLYFLGHGTSQSYTEAVRWYEQASQKGNAMAQYNLVGSSRVDLQACKLEYSIVSPK